MMKLLFVINPKSGNKAGHDFNERVTGFTRKHGFNFRVLETKGEGDEERLAKAIDEFHPDTVIAIGGDGTVNLAASQVVRHEINLAVIPAGSANGLAFNLNIPNDFDKAVEKLVKSRPRPLDAILINNNHYCFHLSDIGINARLVKRFEREGSKGFTGYAIQLFKELRSPGNTFRARIKTSDYERKIKAEMIVIANARSFGTGAQINPPGEIDDGKFEIVIIKPYRWWFMFRILISFFTGNLHKLQNVKVISVGKAKITLEKPQDLQIDGEVFEGCTEIKLEIIPDALKVYY
jgi:YegS/Rv2252/BmrU family lipid kinase